MDDGLPHLPVDHVIAAFRDRAPEPARVAGLSAIAVLDAHCLPHLDDRVDLRRWARVVRDARLERGARADRIVDARGELLDHAIASITALQLTGLLSDALDAEAEAAFMLSALEGLAVRALLGPADNLTAAYADLRDAVARRLTPALHPS